MTLFRHRERRREREVRAVVRDALALRPRLVAALEMTDDAPHPLRMVLPVRGRTGPTVSRRTGATSAATPWATSARRKEPTPKAPLAN